MYNNGYPQPSPAVPAAATYGNYGAYSANPVSYPQPPIQGTNSASNYRLVFKNKIISNCSIGDCSNGYF